MTKRRGEKHPELSVQQEAVMMALLKGSSTTAAAAAAGVDRTTVHRWKRENPVFQALWNRGMNELREDLHAGLLALAESALANLRRAVDEGEPKLSLSVLKLLSSLGPELPVRAPEDPAYLEAMAELASKRAENDCKLARDGLTQEDVRSYLAH